jgi:hypothetical protein
MCGSVVVVLVPSPNSQKYEVALNGLTEVRLLILASNTNSAVVLRLRP